MQTRLLLLLLMAFLPCLGLGQSNKDGELQIVYKGNYYKKGKVVGVTDAGVTLNTDKGKVTVPIDMLPFSLQEELKQRLANQKAAKARTQASSQPGGVKTAPPPLPTATESDEGVEAPKKSVPMDFKMVRDIILGVGLGFLGILFLLGGLLGSSKKLLSLIVAAVCLIGAYFPGRNAIERYMVHEKWTVESAQQEAMRLYPDLTLPGTPLHSAYLSLYTKYQAEKPEYFESPDWPLRLAEEASEL